MKPKPKTKTQFEKIREYLDEIHIDGYRNGACEIHYQSTDKYRTEYLKDIWTAIEEKLGIVQSEPEEEDEDE